jgi:hypothetical protein
MKKMPRTKSILVFTFFLIVFSCDKPNQEIKPDEQWDLETIVKDPMFVSLEQAEKIAPWVERFYTRSQQANSGRVSSPSTVTKSTTATEKGIPYYYVFNYRDGGWTIISSDRRMMPVLAFSKNGSFESVDVNKPLGLDLWENATKQVVKDLRKSKSNVATASITGEWSTLECIPDAVRIGYGRTQECRSPDEFVSQITKGPLLTTNWNQGCGYNASCPQATGGPCGRAWTGCVATAMAQVIRYWQYPSGYNFANMPNNSPNTDVAQLMSAAGISVNMSYGAEASGAYMNDIDDALRNTFRYRSATYSSYNYITVQNNLNNLRPVILGGCNNQKTILGIPYKWSNCHAWVCDGYQQTNYVGYSYLMFHMNWGWGGSYNGWFQFMNWNINGINRNYQYNQDAIVNIQP